MKCAAAVLLGLVFTSSPSLAGIEADQPTETKNDRPWEFTLCNTLALVRDGHDHVIPTLVASHDWLHLEARYNYEALKTGSLWVGYNFSFGEKLKLQAAPIVGAVFGELTGVAPGYSLSLGYKRLKLFTQGEYLFDPGKRANNYFYTWTELTVAPVDWLRVGLVVDRSSGIGTELDIRRGPLVGFSYKKVDFDTYWLNPGSHTSAMFFSITVNF